MDVLDLKLLRDLKRLWAQALAIALVIGSGVATILLAVGSHHSLQHTRDAYYERYGFGDVFAQVRRAPNSLIVDIGKIPGVAYAETRIVQGALLDITDFLEPASAEFISLPDKRDQVLNRLVLRQGRMPDPARKGEVVVDENFAIAHQFRPGSRFEAVLNGHKRQLTIVGTALSPEFVFAVGPGDILPDNRRFAVVWMPERTLAAAYNLEGGFSSVTLKLLPGAAEPEVIRRLDALLEPFGGRAAYGRKDQTSHAWLDHELDMLDNMSRTLPPIFLVVAAFLVNLTLGRVVAIERDQIGLLKAIGYRDRSIAIHYLKFVLIIALAGVAIGSIVGTWLASYLTGLLGDFFRFPFMVSSREPTTYLLGAGLSLAAAATAALRALKSAAAVPPAVAMQPPVPPPIRRRVPASSVLDRIVMQPTMLTLRNIASHPTRTLLTMLGIAMATGILVVSLFMRGTMDQLVDVTYFLADRQDATLRFTDKRPIDVINDVENLPAVLRAEPVREVPVRIRHANVSRRVLLTGKVQDADLSRVIDVTLTPVVLPAEGLAISSMLADTLGVRTGDTVELDILEGKPRTVAMPVAAIVEDYFGIRAMMDASALGRLLREAPAASAVHVSLDGNQTNTFYVKVKDLPVVSGLALQHHSRLKFREVTALLVRTMATIYSALAATIAFGVVYNNARISLSENARDLASLRVMGFTRAQAFRILVLELAILTMLAQPLGWLIGYGLAWVMKTQLATEIMRVRLMVDNFTYALASTIVIVAAMMSALVVRRRVYALDLVSVIKTRD